MKKTLLLTFVVVAALLSSCSSSKKFVYLNDMQEGQGYPVNVQHEAVVQNDDRLSITVSCKNPELAIPFNAGGTAIQVSSDGHVSQTGSGNAKKGYRVDVDGNIEFPLLGKLQVGGLTVKEAESLIKHRIMAGNYIKDPDVAIEFLNFKYSVLGAVNSKGTFTVDGDRITLLEAIAKAGDLPAHARLDRVKVIREENGERKVYVNDIRSKDIFDSPCFYLHQNDIVYVEPRYRKQDKEDKTWKYVTGVLSAITTFCSLYWVFK